MGNKAVRLVLLAMLATFGTSFYSEHASACSIDGKEGFLPRNRLYIPTRRLVMDRDGNPVGGGITEAEFHGVISAVEKFYAPIVKSMGGNLVMKRNWTDGTVNAFADRHDGNWNINMFGGFARHKEMTIDGFLLVVCHELGHQIGGAPKYNAGLDWAANEGQSDYWASLKCARRVLEAEPNLRALPALNAPDSVRIACRTSFPDDNQAALCIRTAMGGAALGRFSASLGGEVIPTFETPDRSRVSTTDDTHPRPQCRMDTYYSGSLCTTDFRKNTDLIDPTIATCAQEKGDSIGFRPRCWYAPQDDNTTQGNPNPRGPQPGRYY